MINVKERLAKALEVLFENRVFSEKYNTDPYFIDGSHADLQLRTNYLSLRDMKIILYVCQLYTLDVAVNEIPSVQGQSISVIFSCL